ncbi:hypothetical protein VB153_13665, partial [Xanthomonas fragariae]
MEADFFIFPRIVIMRTRIANKPSVAFVRASLSTQANLPLEAWLGRRATLYTRLADGGESPRTGLIHEAYE